MAPHFPHAEVVVDENLVAALLEDQHPDLADRPLVRIGAGWDNVTFRLGDDLAVRLPRRALAANLLRNEQRWLPVLAPRLGIRIPAPVRIGRPGRSYPWPWSVVPWIAGTTADAAPLDQAEATRLAEVLRALHRPAPPEAPGNVYRGVPLHARSEAVRARLDALGRMEGKQVERLRRIWREGLDAEPAREQVWLHGDLHPRNVLVESGRLAGLIDWGDLTAGDRATDLACAWMLFPSRDHRSAFWHGCRASTADRLRAHAWAVFFGVSLSNSGESAHETLGRTILATLLASR